MENRLMHTARERTNARFVEYTSSSFAIASTIPHARVAVGVECSCFGRTMGSEMKSNRSRRRMGESGRNFRMQMQHSEDWFEPALCKHGHAGLNLVHAHAGSALDGHFGLTRETSFFFIDGESA